LSQLPDPELGTPLHPLDNVETLYSSRKAIPDLCIKLFGCPQCFAHPGEACFYVLNGELGTKMRGVHYRRLAVMWPDALEELPANPLTARAALLAEIRSMISSPNTKEAQML